MSVMLMSFLIVSSSGFMASMYRSGVREATLLHGSCDLESQSKCVVNQHLTQGVLVQDFNPFSIVQAHIAVC